MNVSIVGSGYVGTTVAACLADAGHDVVNIDLDEDIVAAINAGQSPIYETGLEERIRTVAGDRLRATTEYSVIPDTELTMLCLPTPVTDAGKLDLTAIKAGTRSLGKELATKPAKHVVVVKSTVLPGTTDETIAPLLEETTDKHIGDEIGLATNPEFLREGSAVEDFLHPDKIVIGATEDWTRNQVKSLYEPVVTDTPIFETGTREAEMIKYANNAFLASKISLINDIGNICKNHGVDTYEVAEALGLDDRIGAKFLQSGLGWGGSCFSKDLAAIIDAARESDYDPPMLNAAVEVNDGQPARFLRLMDQHTDVTGERVAVLGLAFKPGTDDIRNARSIPVIHGLLERDAHVAAYDPVASANMQELFPDIEYASTALGALKEAVAALVVTDWDEFSALSSEFETMKTPIVIDGRHIIDFRDGIVYEGLTW